MIDVNYLNELLLEKYQKHGADSFEYKRFKHFYGEVIDLMMYKSDKDIDEQMIQQFREEDIYREFERRYSDNDILAHYCEENEIYLTPETIDAYSEEDFKLYKEKLFEQYKTNRGL